MHWSPPDHEKSDDDDDVDDNDGSLWGCHDGEGWIMSEGLNPKHKLKEKKRE